MAASDNPVSVVMPVRNAMPFLDAAVASILAQTHGEFELVIGDDGSTDGSGARLKAWAARDGRIRLLRNDGPGLGPAGSGNWVARAARFPLIARMDADDISLPDRLRRQVSILQRHPDAVLVGSLFETIDRNGGPICRRDRSTLVNPKCCLPAAHGTFMLRRDAFERAGGYRAQCDYWEDIDLFLRIGRQGRVLILPEAHYLYRLSPTSSRLVSNEDAVARSLDLALRCLDAHRRGRDYEALLRRDASAPPRAKVSPAVLIPAVLPRLWSDRPRSLLAWGRRHASFGWDRASATALILAFWAWLAPGSLRAYIRLRTKLADRRAGRVIADGEVYPWPVHRPDGAGAAPARTAGPAREPLLPESAGWAART